MRLISQEIYHFKGVKHFKFEANGQSKTIIGDNETGKSTMLDAHLWLLTDRDSLDRTALLFDIKTNNRQTGESIPDLDHSVEEIFELADGSRLKLKKVYKEKWKGEGSKRIIDTHFTEYYVDDLKKTAGEFKDTIEKILPIERLKMLSLVNYFAETLDSEKAREVLTEMADEITDEMIIKDYPNLKRYPEALNGRSLEDAIDYLDQQKSLINTRKKELPGLITENENKIKDDINLEQIQKQIEESEKLKEDLQKKLATTESEEMKNLDSEIQKLNTLMVQRKNELLEERNSDKANEIRERIKTKEQEKDVITKKIRERNEKISELQSEVNRIEKRLDPKNQDGLILEIEATKSVKPRELKSVKECYACNQKLPKDQIEKSKKEHESYVEKFNKNKAEKLKELIEAVDGHEKALKESKENLSELEFELEEITINQQAVQGTINDLENELKKEIQAVPDPMDDETYLDLLGQSQQLAEKKEELSTGVTKDKRQIENEIFTVSEQIKELYKSVGTHDSQIEIKDRIKQLRDEQETIGQKLEKIEADLFLFDQFKKAKARYVTERVNKKFELVEWRLFREQLNGSLKEICEPYYKGVAFSKGLNFAGRIIAGVDIIRTLTDHFGIQVPLFLDDVNLITTKPNTGSIQVFWLQVLKGVQKIKISD